MGGHGITATEVNGFGRQKGHAELYLGSEYVENFLPKVKLEIAFDAAAVEAIINAITVSAHTGKSGDEKIFVTSPDLVVRIRTGETGSSAI